MAHHTVREDKTCLNCRQVVEKRFCPNCGQENVDSRKTFYHLFVHFFEDLTHYENAFWKTIRNLLFKPASLTIEYLSGRRLSYLAPVRLYIFLSFVTFLFITLVPESDSPIVTPNKKELQKATTELKEKEEKKEIATKFAENDLFDFGYDSVAELDSIQKFGKPKERLTDFQYWINRKLQVVKDNNTTEEILEKFKESFVHNFPKLLIVYMPIFAFILWLFHNKKKWYYFDHGIFTLHYFSFLLLVLLLVSVLGRIESVFDFTLINYIVNLIDILLFVWMVYYFYPAHHRFYQQSRMASFFKTSLLFFINSIILIFIMTFYIIYTFINIH